MLWSGYPDAEQVNTTESYVCLAYEATAGRRMACKLERIPSPPTGRFVKADLVCSYPVDSVDVNGRRNFCALAE